MIDELVCSNKVVGLKQTVRAIDEENVSKVFLACDISPDIFEKISIMCKEKGIEVEHIKTMKEIGNICKIDVPAAVAAILKNVL
ncbi:MAG: ribosomal L7Ae/L30e/S12e/Gadd45 family protein [Clostridia bacterium]|nr:ribosomal L7Ae/L30e/S12e/Gadd45 family protein [Clostridia bacterium]